MAPREEVQGTERVSDSHGHDCEDHVRQWTQGSDRQTMSIVHDS